jgi:putative CocE/NonD family hydrolase
MTRIEKPRPSAACPAPRLHGLAALWAAAAALALAGLPGFAGAASTAGTTGATGADSLADQAAADGPATPPNVAERYTKYEFRIPMRDGAKLFTVVYLPKDSSKSLPFLMMRTPYSVGAQSGGALRYGVDFINQRLGPSDDFIRAGYIFVNQDVRGRWMSDGKWVEMQPHNPAKKGPADVDASTDMHDTVEWLLKNIPGHNGRVGIWGISYPGFYASASIIDSHPAIKAASPQAPVTNLYMNDDAYHNGAFMLAANYGFYTFFKPQTNPTDQPRRNEVFDYGTASAYDYFLKLGTLRNITNSLKPEQRPYFAEPLAHPNLDAYWQARDISVHLKNVKAAVLTVGGWYDAEDPQGPFTTYQAIEQFNPGATNLLVVGPWVHGGWARLDGARLGHVNFAAATGDYYRKHIVFPFFEKYLRGDDAKTPGAPPATELAKATVFETGTNVWRRYAAWPPQAAQARTLYLQAGGRLGFQPPAQAAGAAYDEYISDPAKPVPFTSQPALEVPQDYVVGDQRFAATRPDVLSYQTEPLDADVTVVGPLEPRLFVSTTGTDADWVVKLIDVYPDAYPEAPAEPAGGGAGGASGAKPPLDVKAPALPMAGYQQLVRGEPMRGKFRNSFERPEPFVPGQVAAVNFRMPDVNHTFRRGHRIMVQVQSSWFPLIDRNLQTFVNIPDAKAEDFRTATQRVWHSPTQASGIALRVMPGIGQAAGGPAGL